MKKVKLFLGLLLTCSICFSQGRINYKMSELLNEFSKDDFPNRSYGKNSDGETYHLFIADDYGKVGYYFDKDSVCYKTIFVAFDEAKFNYFTSFCDKKYKKINNKKWIAIDKETHFKTDVEIVEDENDIFFKRLGKYAKFTFSNK